jgi:uncharacterized protein (TIGR03437 family)
MSKPQRCLALWAILGAASPAVLAQPDRVTARIDSNQSVVLSGRVPRFATASNDAGAVASSFPISGITLMLKASAAQQADLDQLLLAQQDPKSPNFHQWLTPEQYANRFGASAGDLAKIAAWVESQGFTVGYTARARNYVTFSGTAQQVANAFHTQIHSYNVNGETHYANATDPSIPAALSGLVSGIRGLDNFRPKPRFKKAQPHVILHREQLVGPTDFAAIYDVNALYSAGIKGDGQKIVIVGQSQILTSDITAFRNAFGLGAPNLTMLPVPGLGIPGISPGDETESDLDVEWAGAVAPNATIVFVYADPSVGGVGAALSYAIDHALAPVLSTSYGLCEEIDGYSDLAYQRSLAQQANSEGMTMLAASGDYAAADCDEWDNNPVVAEGGLAVDQPGSVPEVTAMGGTEFNEGSGNYWTNGTATGYIPEVVWNDTAQVGQLDGGGGGASIYFTQPAWQNGVAPNDGMRHVPDLSFSASNVHDSLYIYSSDTSNGPAGAQAVGGTSCAAPTMAGVVALLNQYLVSTSAVKQAGLGNINPTLYKLAKTQSSAFHDIVNGSNIVPCADSPDCINGALGWAAGTGYDSASGLGSVDAYNLVRAWSTALATQAVVVPSIDQNPVYEVSSNLWSFTLTLTEEAGIAATVTGVTINGTSYTSSQIVSLFGTAAIAARGSISNPLPFSLQGLDVSNGPVNVVFTFSGVDAGGANWSTTLTVPFEGPQPVLAVGGFSNAASGQQLFAPGMLISVYGSGMGNYVEAASVTPLPEYMAGFEAYITDQFGNQTYPPLLYVSPNQVNLQIPYEVPAGPAQLVVGNPYINTSPINFTVSNAAPGIFSYPLGPNQSPIGDRTTNTARAGQEVAIYVTGVGHVSIDPNDGATPLLNSNPYPVLPVSITVGGVTVAQPFAFMGIPNWSVGVLQINFTIPSGVGTGQQPVVVTVGGAQSLPANITVTQ